MNPIRPHGFMNIPLAQLATYNFNAHKWKVTAPSVTGLQLKEVSSLSLYIVY